MNIIILVLYRTGYRGGFLGVGGTWNLNEEKNPDAEIVASGVFIGFFIYTTVILISYGFGSNHQKKTLVVNERLRSIFGNDVYRGASIILLCRQPNDDQRPSRI